MESRQLILFTRENCVGVLLNFFFFHCNYHLLKNICLLGRNTGKPTSVMLTLPTWLFFPGRGGWAPCRLYHPVNTRGPLHPAHHPFTGVRPGPRRGPPCLSSSVLPRESCCPFFTLPGPHFTVSLWCWWHSREHTSRSWLTVFKSILDVVSFTPVLTQRAQP